MTNNSNNYLTNILLLVIILTHVSPENPANPFMVATVTGLVVFSLIGNVLEWILKDD